MADIADTDDLSRPVASSPEVVRPMSACEARPLGGSGGMPPPQQVFCNFVALRLILVAFGTFSVVANPNQKLFV